MMNVAPTCHNTPDFHFAALTAVVAASSFRPDGLKLDMGKDECLVTRGALCSIKVKTARQKASAEAQKGACFLKKDVATTRKVWHLRGKSIPTT